jgi:cyclic beta-1,2-glucan synthetase
MSLDHNSATHPGESVEARARQLAHDHGEVTVTTTEPLLLTQHQAQARFLRQADAAFVREAQQEMLPSSHVAEWLLDNFHIVQRYLRRIDEDMPATFYHELPKLTTGPFAGYPRVYAIAHDAVQADAAHVDAERLQRFVQAYQQVTPLQMGELWALPVMLRVNVIEVLVHVVAQALETAAPETAVVPPIIAAADKVVQSAGGLHSEPARAGCRGLDRVFRGRQPG